VNTHEAIFSCGQHKQPQQSCMQLSVQEDVHMAHRYKKVTTVNQVWQCSDLETECIS